MDAGEAQGVTLNAEFAVYETKARVKELGRLVVQATRAFDSELKFAENSNMFSIPKNPENPENTTYYCALQTRIGDNHDVRLLVEFSDALSGVFTALGQQMRVKEAWKPSFKVITSPSEDPDLVITSAQGVARLQLSDTVCHLAGLYEIPYRPATDSATMTRVLRATADFYYNFRRAPISGKHLISPKIDVECHELQPAEELGDDLEEVFKPVDVKKNLVVDGVINLDIDGNGEEKNYGFTIRNKSSVSLFVSVFYFNMSDLSISMSASFLGTLH